MAGFSRIYLIGEPGGFQGADGINSIHLQIWVGDADRQWYEAHYFEDDIKPIANLRSMVPESSENPNALLDACIAFYPDVFKNCLHFSAVKNKLRDCTMLDFNLGKKDIPEEWYELRKEARKIFEGLYIFEAKLKKLTLRDAFASP